MSSVPTGPKFITSLGLNACISIALLWGAIIIMVSIDQIVHPDNEVPTEVVIEDKTLIEQVRLINSLEEKDKNVIFAMLETMITKQKFKDFFNNNVATL